MPDISMCNNKSCKKFSECYRAQAFPSKYRQAYTTFGEPDCDGCEDFKVIYTRTQKTLAEKDDFEMLCEAVNAFMNTKEETKHDKRKMNRAQRRRWLKQNRKNSTCKGTGVEP